VLARHFSRPASGRPETPTPFGHPRSAPAMASWWPTRSRTEHRRRGAPRWP
jgi:hypothetical protein